MPVERTRGSRKESGHRVVALAIIVVHTGLLAWGAYRQSPTYNEAGHLVAGISHWDLGTFEVDRVNPPLTDMVGALTLLATSIDVDWRTLRDAPFVRPEYPLGQAFLSDNGVRSLWLCTVARWAVIPFSWLGAWICFRWARELFGGNAGLIALVLWCFCPNVLAHADLVSADAGGAAFGVASAYAFWRWLKTPTWGWTLIAGGALSLAELTKFTWLILFGLWPAVFIAWRLSDAARGDLRGWLNHGLQLVVVLMLAVCAINLGYFCRGSLKRLDSFEFVSASLRGSGSKSHVRMAVGNRFAGTGLGRLPVPLPRDFVIGLDVQKRDCEDFDKPSYLGGEFRQSGWWYYYLYAAAIKVPLGTWLLFVLSCAAPFLLPGCRTRFRDSLVVLSPMLVLLALVSSQTGLNQHFRYALPAFPFAFIWISRVACAFDSGHTGFKRLIAAALAWSIASSLWIYPHSLSYFNELVGGPNGGSAHLLGSNVDWCQDLIFLKEWVDAHPEAKPLQLAYFGYMDPHDVGLKYTLPRFASEQSSKGSIDKAHGGWLALSVNFARGESGTSTRSDGRQIWIPHHAFPEWEGKRPDAQAGYSILLFRLK